MSGMNRFTGKKLDGWDHINQSLQDIFTTRVGSRIQRRAYGSDGPNLVDKPANNETVLDHFVAMAYAIDEFEPRVELNGFGLAEANADGEAQIYVDVTVLSNGFQQRTEAQL